MNKAACDIPAVIETAITADARFRGFRDLFVGLCDEDLRVLSTEDLRQIGVNLAPNRRALFAVLLNRHVFPFVAQKDDKETRTYEDNLRQEYEYMHDRLSELCTATPAVVTINPDHSLSRAASISACVYSPERHANSKNELQELRVRAGLLHPEYKEICRTGPAHQPTFFVECRMDGAVCGRGQGRTRADAEKAAAADAMGQ